MERLQVDLNDFGPNDPMGCFYTLEVADPDNLQSFDIIVKPGGGLWKDGKFRFHFDIPDDFPHETPNVTAATRLWHPNIEELPRNRVCLNILNKAWTPTITIRDVARGLLFLFDAPNPNDPFNADAATQMSTNPEGFRTKVMDYVDQYASD
jgi:ubiquitin-conjugating enzyme E2 M